MVLESVSGAGFLVQVDVWGGPGRSEGVPGPWGSPRPRRQEIFSPVRVALGSFFFGNASGMSVWDTIHLIGFTRNMAGFSALIKSAQGAVRLRLWATGGLGIFGKVSLKLSAEADRGAAP